MGVYTNIVSSAKPVNAIRTFIGGVAKDITSAWVFVGGVRKQVFPTTEVWTLVSENTTAGAYSETLSWGKYKIVISGAGGGGAASAWGSGHGTRYTNDGSAGEEKTIYVDVADGSTLSVSGTIGAGGTGGKAKIENVGTNAGGNGGTGYQNGSNGTAQTYRPSNIITAATAGGGGGGSTSVEWNSTVQGVAKGGNGGESRYAAAYLWGYGGTGGSGGTNTGTGASGGVAAHTSNDHQMTGGTGTDGYVKIYKSNIYPA